jgi:hypothetical protein
MPTQRMTIATLTGLAASTVMDQFEQWQTYPDPLALDKLCESIPSNAEALSIIYFNQWIDCWLMGNDLCGPDALDGKRFQLTCITATLAKEWAARCGKQFAEHQWLATRLTEAADCRGDLAQPYAVLVIREVIGPSRSEDEIQDAANTLPAWLTQRIKP